MTINTNESARVFHPRFGNGTILENLGKTSLVKFDDGNFVSVHTRLLTNNLKEVVKPFIPEPKPLKTKQKRHAILKALENKTSYAEVAKEFGISRQYVCHIAKENGIDVKSQKKERLKSTMKEIIAAIDSGLNYDEVKIKFPLSKKELVSMDYYFGFKIPSFFIKKRNETIVGSYKFGYKAKDLLSNETKQLTSIRSVYDVIKGDKAYKYPQIKRGFKGLFEDKEILDIIVKLKNKNKSYGDIAKHLNKKGYKTITGKKFKWHHVFFKYRKVIDKNKAKLKKVDMSLNRK